MNIMHRLLLTVLLAAIPIGVLQAISVRRELGEEREAMAMAATGIAYRAAAEQRRIAEGARQLLSAMSQMPSVRGGDATNCSLVVKRLQAQFRSYTAIGVADANGRIWCSSVRAGTDVSDRAYFKQAVSTGRFTTGGYVVGRVLGTRTLNFSLPIYDSAGKLSGVLVAGLELDRLALDLGKAMLPQSSILMIYGPDRRVLVRLPHGNGNGVGTPLPRELEQAFAARKPGTMEGSWLDGRRRLIAFIPPAADGEMPFLVAVGIDQAVAVAGIEARARQAIIVLVVVLLAALLFAWWFAARYVRHPVEKLARTVRAWQHGDATARVGPLHSGAEFDDLAQAFDALSDDVLERKRRLRNALENTTDSVSVLSAQWEFTFVNERAIERLGSMELIGRSFWDVFPEMLGGYVEETLYRAMEGRQPVFLTYENKVLGGYFQTNAYPAEDGGLIMYSRDVTEEQRAQEQLRYLALNDPLTGLPNRSRAMELARAHAAQGRLSAMLLLDLDSFKHVNDSFGHPAGDEMLRIVAQRLISCMGELGAVARLGGDEFVVLLTDASAAQSVEMAKKLLHAVESETFIIRGREQQITCSCGLVLVASEATASIEEMLANADIALYRAKAAGGGSCCTYTSADRDAFEARLQLDDEVAEAARNSQFELYYQPQIRLEDGEVVGVEALLRWNHPGRGLLVPASFIDALQASRHAEAVGTWVIEEACRQAAAWWRAGRRLRFSVNLFPQQLSSGELPGIVKAALRRHSLPPHALELELTENIALAAQAEVKRTLLTLRMLGVGLAFDDFGTGFASLTTLKDLPVNRLKIDRSFVTQLPYNEHDRAIVEAVLALARTLGLEVVAEGIETDEQADYLSSRGCQEGQGYRFGKPMTADAFADHLSCGQGQVRLG